MMVISCLNLLVFFCYRGKEKGANRRIGVPKVKTKSELGKLKSGGHIQGKGKNHDRRGARSEEGGRKKIVKIEKFEADFSKTLVLQYSTNKFDNALLSVSSKPNKKTVEGWDYSYQALKSENLAGELLKVAEEKKFDFVLFLSADTLILRSENFVQKLLEENEMKEKWMLGLERLNHGGEVWDVNGGFLLFNMRHPTTQKVLERWQSSGESGRQMDSFREAVKELQGNSELVWSHTKLGGGDLATILGKNVVQVANAQVERLNFITAAKAKMLLNTFFAKKMRREEKEKRK